jgi:hypothetical protein
MITSVTWFAPTEAQVAVLDKTHTFPNGSLPAVVCCHAAPSATSSIHWGHHNLRKIKG